MSVDATHWAWRVNCANSTHRLVLLALADRANETSECWPSITRLEADTCLNRKTIIKAIFDLEAQKMINVSRSNGGNLYKLLGVNHRESSPKNGTASNTNLGTSPDIGTSPKNGTRVVPKTVLGVVPKTVHESKRESNKNLKALKATRKTNDAHVDPHDFKLTPEIISWANEKCFTELPERLEYFRDYCLANEKTYPDWTRAFMNSVRSNWAKIDQTKKGNHHAKPSLIERVANNIRAQNQRETHSAVLVTHDDDLRLRLD